MLRDFHFISVVIAPEEADPELIVDSYAMLALAIAFKPLKPVAGNLRQGRSGCSLRATLQVCVGATFSMLIKRAQG
jgi:hypothetical protein